MTDAVKWYCRQAIEEISRRVNAQKKFLARYTIEGLNSFATVLYFNYLYFFMPRSSVSTTGKTSRSPRCSAWFTPSPRGRPGKFAHRLGYFTTLKLGFGVMIAGLLSVRNVHRMTGQIIAACIVNVGMCCHLADAEALVSEGETRRRAARRGHLQHRVGHDQCVRLFHRRHAH
jgi:hypothetical protein